MSSTFKVAPISRELELTSKVDINEKPHFMLGLLGEFLSSQDIT
jgi:hypothetical protein